MNWKFTQENSDKILSDGLYILKTRPYQTLVDINENSFGNYLISYNKNPLYIGEAQDLSKRLKQQFNPKHSTFYKTYSRHQNDNKLLQPLEINNFNIQATPTSIGRKEIEEFGIVNLQTLLNSFQKGKRKIHEIKSQDGLWVEVQSLKKELIEQAGQIIISNSFKPWADNQVKQTAGIYLVKSKTDQLLYIGESSNIKGRFNTHSGHTYFSALRRHIGTVIFNFQLQGKRYFSVNEDLQVSNYLKSCCATFYPVTFGRYELEEFLIKEHRPLLNRKGNPPR